MVMAQGNVRLRAEPTLESERLAFVAWGGTATLLGYDSTGEWIQVDYQGIVGWTAAAWWKIGVTAPAPSSSGGSTAPTSNLTTTTVSSSPTGVIVMALGNIRLRTEPSLEGERLTSMAWGDQAAALAISADGEWVLLDFAGVQGWAAAAWFDAMSGSFSALPVQ
jgi:uncharacterized protein YraI